MGRIYNRGEMKIAMKRAYAGLFIKDGEEFSGQFEDTNSLWLSAEDGTVDKRGCDIFDYYAESSLYEMGVIKHLAAWAERHGWYFEYYDAGTIFMFPDE